MTIQFTSLADFPKATSPKVKELALTENVAIHFKLDEAVKKRGITIHKLSTITGIRPATLSTYTVGNPTVINSAHLMAIIVALRVTDISELFEIQMDTETEEKFNKDKQLWIENGWQPIYKKDSEES